MLILFSVNGYESPHSSTYAPPVYDEHHEITTEHDFDHSIPSGAVYNPEPTDAYDPYDDYNPFDHHQPFDDPLMYDPLEEYDPYLTEYPPSFDDYDYPDLYGHDGPGFIDDDLPEIYTSEIPHIYDDPVTDFYDDISTEIYDDISTEFYDHSGEFDDHFDSTSFPPATSYETSYEEIKPVIERPYRRKQPTHRTTKRPTKVTKTPLPPIPTYKPTSKKPKLPLIKKPSLRKKKPKGKFSVLDLLHDVVPIHKKKRPKKPRQKPHYGSRGKGKVPKSRPKKKRPHTEPVETYTTKIHVDEPMYYEDIQYHTPSPYAEHDLYAQDEELYESEDSFQVEESYVGEDSYEDDFNYDDEYEDETVFYRKPDSDQSQEEVYYTKPEADFDQEEPVYYKNPDYSQFYKPKEFPRHQSEYNPSTTEVIPELKDVLKSVDWNVKDFTQWNENLVEPDYPYYYTSPKLPPKLVPKQPPPPRLPVQTELPGYAYEPTTPLLASSSLPADPPIPNPFLTAARPPVAVAAPQPPPPPPPPQSPSLDSIAFFRESRYVAPEPFDISFDDWLNTSGVEQFGMPSTNIMTYELPFLAKAKPPIEEPSPSTSEKLIGPAAPPKSYIFKESDSKLHA